MVSLRDDQLKAAEVPLYIHERKAGRLHISREGLYTVLEAELPECAAELVRLWAHGEGKSACLGVMLPHNGGLYFSRKLSRRELTDFPDPIEFASDRGYEQEKFTENNLHNSITAEEAKISQGKENENDLHNTNPKPDGAESVSGSSHAGGENSPVQNRAGDREETAPCPAETDYRACPAEPPEEGLLWYRRPDGSLVSFDGVSTLLALPAQLRAPSPRAAERVIDGKKYLVFRT